MAKTPINNAQIFLWEVIVTTTLSTPQYLQYPQSTGTPCTPQYPTVPTSPQYIPVKRSTLQYIVIPCTLQYTVYLITTTFHKKELQVGVFAIPPSYESSAV